MSDGTGSIYKRGNVWWIYYGHDGRRHRESSGSHRKRDARDLLTQRLAEIGAGTFVGPAAKAVRFADLKRIIHEFYVVNGRTSIRRLETALAHLEEHFGHMRAIHMTTPRLRSYIGKRQEEGAANASIRKEFAALRKAFKIAVEDGMLTVVPHFPTVTVNNTRQGFVSRDDLEAMCAYLDDDVEPIVRFAYLTGWRKGKVLPLRWEQVDWELGTVRPGRGADNKPTGKPFPFHQVEELASLLRRQRERTDALARETGSIIPWVFHRDGEEIKGFRRQWNSACLSAGLGEWKTDRDGKPVLDRNGHRIKVHSVVFHDLKRSAVRNFERAGISRSVGMQFTGHKTPSIYGRYAIADAVALEEGAAKLEALNRRDRASNATVTPQLTSIEPISRKATNA